MAMEPAEANNQVEASSRESAPQQEQRAGRENTCAYAHVCEQYDLPAYEDRHETHSYLGWRVIGTMIAWLILGKAVSGDTFFVACFLFAYPILLDCIKFKPVNKLRRLIKWAEVAVSMVWLVSTASRVFYRKPNKGWHSVAVIPWRGTKAESEDDLTAYAEKHKMKLLKEDKK